LGTIGPGQAHRLCKVIVQKWYIGTDLFYCYLCSVYMMSSQHQVMSNLLPCNWHDF